MFEVAGGSAPSCYRLCAFLILGIYHYRHTPRRHTNIRSSCHHLKASESDRRRAGRRTKPALLTDGGSSARPGLNNIHRSIQIIKLFYILVALSGINISLFSESSVFKRSDAITAPRRRNTFQNWGETGEQTVQTCRWWQTGEKQPPLWVKIYSKKYYIQFLQQQCRTHLHKLFEFDNNHKYLYK